MVNANILTLFYYLIFFFSTLFSKHLKSIITTNYKFFKNKTKQNVFRNTYMHECYICNNLKMKFRPHEIENRIHK
jgi:hypothetical protein